MNRPMLRTSSLLLLSALFAACLDVAPQAPLEAEADAGAADAPALDGPVPSPCRSCITGDAASCPAYEECLNTPRCPEFMACVFDKRCLDLPQFDQRVDCAMPCTAVAGIPDVYDPAIGVAIRINQCALEGCGSVCAKGL
jgi:hypothetical protein